MAAASIVLVTLRSTGVNLDPWDEVVATRLTVVSAIHFCLVVLKLTDLFELRLQIFECTSCQFSHPTLYQESLYKFKIRCSSFRLVIIATIFLYDFLHLLPSEISLIWYSPWSKSKAAFLVQRYAPFVDTLLLVALGREF
jgi:hypothetical protein